MAAEGRMTAVRVIAVIMAVAAVGFGLFTAVFGLISEEQKIHAFHNSVVASLLLVVSAPATFAVARDPKRSARHLVILAAVGVAGLVTMALSLTLDPFTFPVIVLVGVLWLLRPNREQAFPTGRPSPILLLLVLAAAVPLVAFALGQAELQRVDDSSEHAQFYHWVETSFYAMSILLLGALAAVRPAAYRLAAWCATIALAVLGVGSLLLPDYPSAVDTSWAWAALAGSVVFVAVAEWDARRSRPG